MPLTAGIAWTVAERAGTTPLVVALHGTGHLQREESLVPKRATLTTAGASFWAVLGGSVSVAGLATPTYFAYPLNVVVLAAGVWLTAAARSAVQGRRTPEPA